MRYRKGYSRELEVIDFSSAFLIEGLGSGAAEVLAHRGTGIHLEYRQAEKRTPRRIRIHRDILLW